MSVLAGALADLKKEKVMAEIIAMKDAGTPPLIIVEELQEGMRQVGERFEAGEFYLSELIMSALIFKEAMDDLEHLLGPEGTATERGVFVIGTVEGDIHHIGKNVVSTVLGCHGFRVVDLGENVTAERFVEAVREHTPLFVGLSCLLTTAFDTMKSTIEMLESEGLREKLAVLIGGAPCTEETRAYVGADAVCSNAQCAVDTAKAMIDTMT